MGMDAVVAPGHAVDGHSKAATQDPIFVPAAGAQLPLTRRCSSVSVLGPATSFFKPWPKPRPSRPGLAGAPSSRRSLGAPPLILGSGPHPALRTTWARRPAA